MPPDNDVDQTARRVTDQASTTTADDNKNDATAAAAWYLLSRSDGIMVDALTSAVLSSSLESVVWFFVLCQVTDNWQKSPHCFGGRIGWIPVPVHCILYTLKYRTVLYRTSINSNEMALTK